MYDSINIGSVIVIYDSIINIICIIITNYIIY